METNRYNVFNNIHKGLRAMLFQTQLQVQQTDFTQPEAASVIDGLELALLYFDEHANHEDRFILSNIIKQEPELAKAFEEDHVTDHKLSEDLRRYIANWKNASAGSGKEIAGRQIFYAMNEFIAFNLYHMNKEENQLLEVLWKHYTDAEILGMEEQIVASIDPQVLMAESRWMMRSMSCPEIAAWLEGIRLGAPAHVYEMYMQMAKEELSEERMEKLERCYILN